MLGLQVLHNPLRLKDNLQRFSFSPLNLGPKGGVGSLGVIGLNVHCGVGGVGDYNFDDKILPQNRSKVSSTATRSGGTSVTQTCVLLPQPEKLWCFLFQVVSL